MVTMVLPLPRERRLDSDAAAPAIRDVRLEVLWDTGELYPWEYRLGEVETLPEAFPGVRGPARRAGRASRLRV
jgi:hypothetical protein